MSGVEAGWYADPSKPDQWRWWDGSQWTSSVSRNGEAFEEPLTRAATRSLTKPTLAAPASVSATAETDPVVRKKKLPTWAWIAIGIVALILLVPLANVYALIALVVLITGIVALARNTSTWLRLSSRKLAIGATAGSAAVLLVAGSVSAASMSQLRAPELPADKNVAEIIETPDPTPTATATPDPEPTPVVKEETVVEAIPFEKATVEDGSIPSGQSQVTTPGAEGEKTTYFEVTYLDGVETGRVAIREEVTRQPVTEVTTVGTYVAPPPPPPAQPACHPNYADACVPIADDVDCEGGSGNGPAYVRGPVRVVGEDVYGLDSNGDGIGCER